MPRSQAVLRTGLRQVLPVREISSVRQSVSTDSVEALIQCIPHPHNPVTIIHQTPLVRAGIIHHPSVRPTQTDTVRERTVITVIIHRSVRIVSNQVPTVPTDLTTVDLRGGQVADDPADRTMAAAVAADLAAVPEGVINQ